jgi:hypothetical protein
VTIRRPPIWLALALLLAACAALIALGRARSPTLSLGVAEARLRGPAFSDGIYARERGPDGAPYRWTSGSAVIQLRGAANAAPAYLLTLRLRSAHPTSPQPLTLLADGQALAVTTPSPAFRTYRMLVAPAADGELRLNLRTATFVAAGNPRPLGVVLADLSLRPLPAADWPAAGLLALLLLALWLAAGPSGGQPAALALVALSGLGLAAAAALYRPAPLPFPLLAALCLLAIIAATLLARPPAARLGLAALCLLVSFSGVLWPSWLSDDAFISFRYAQNLAAGNGLVYNLGERVEGYTNFLWTLLAAGVLALGGDLLLAAYLAGVLLGLAIVLLTYALAERLCGPAWGLAAALIAGTSQSLLIYTARGAGLETGLFTLLALAGSACYLMADRRPAWLAAVGALLALAALTRPEGLLVFGVTLLAQGRAWLAARSRPSAPAWLAGPPPAPGDLLWLAGPFLLIFLPYFLWRFSYYGDPLPNTFYAKTGGGLLQALRGLQYAGWFALTLGGPLLLLVCLPWLRGWRAALASWRGYLLPLALIYSAYIVAVGGDHFRGERFFVPVLPWLAILLADGLAVALPARPSRPARAALALLLAAGGLAALARSAPVDATIGGVDESVWIWRELGWWMADNTPPDATLAARGAGAVAFYSQRSVIDLLGLTDKHIARLAVADMGAGTAGHEKSDPAYVLNDRRPTYIPQIWDDYFGGAEALRGRYRLLPIVTRSGRIMQLWQRRP